MQECMCQRSKKARGRGKARGAGSDGESLSVVPKGTLRPEGHGEEPTKRARGDWRASGPPEGVRSREVCSGKPQSRSWKASSGKPRKKSKLLDLGVTELAAGCRISY